MKNIIKLDPNFSTTRCVVKAELNEILNGCSFISKAVERANEFENKLETQLFIKACANQPCEGGLRKKGYFKVGGIIPLSLLTKAEQSVTPLVYQASPLITVVTVVFNGETVLEDTILSVINQTYDNVEYIIIDGGSTDGTLGIIKKYEDYIDYWVSAKDNGIYDAMNKGIELATGEWINFMNCGDKFIENSVFHDICTSSMDKKVNLIFGKSITFYKEVSKIRYEDFCTCSNDFFLKKMPNHQAVFIRKSIFKKIKYDLNYSFYADTVYLRRAFSIANIHEYKGVISKFELGGVSNYYRTFKNFRGLVADSQKLKGNKIKPFLIHLSKFFLQKILGKDLYLKLYIKKVLR